MIEFNILLHLLADPAPWWYDRQVFVNYEGMNLWGYEVKGLQVDGWWRLLYEVYSSLEVTNETYSRFFDFAVNDLFDVQGYGVMGLRGYGAIVLRGYGVKALHVLGAYLVTRS